MAKRLCFFLIGDYIRERYVDFTYVSGLAFSQKVKCAASLQNEIKRKYPASHPLEVSTKSTDEIGKSLSAFNLKSDGCYVESIFQSSKVFEGGVQFEQLLNKDPREAKKAIKEYGHHPLVAFRYKGKEYPLVPRSAFYDWIYINALSKSEYADLLSKYDVFTDIEFNDQKSLNCQARAVAIFVLITKMGKRDFYLSSFENFISVYDLIRKDTLSLLR